MSRFRLGCRVGITFKSSTFATNAKASHQRPGSGRRAVAADIAGETLGRFRCNTEVLNFGAYHVKGPPNYILTRISQGSLIRVAYRVHRLLLQYLQKLHEQVPLLRILLSGL